MCSVAQVDRDFCDMATATTFVQGKGGYSQLIADLRTARAKHTVFLPELAATEHHSKDHRPKPVAFGSLRLNQAST